ncbi:MAG: thiamine phosphate synthase, partial [Muribaculaceae bacterium]|nr:thiamine phosphate synthase [Muribaculaceae bacterium]
TCIEKEVFLILNDRVELAKELNVGGVHLGREDMPPSKARMMLGPAAVIGVTANTYSDIISVSALDIDYYGIGPFRHTTTKKNLSPVLGIDGIRKICYEMEENHIEIPRVAVGGIGYDDILPLLEAGVNGVAVSGAIANASDIAAETKRFISLLPTHE